MREIVRRAYRIVYRLVGDDQVHVLTNPSRQPATRVAAVNQQPNIQMEPTRCQPVR